MSVQQAVWTNGRVERRPARWSPSIDLLAVLTVCLIFGLQILVVMQNPGGPEVYRSVASEGMRSR
ncbi:MAG TPA: hypothetical protein VG270_05675 [Pseudolabrys sp.]|nr:hypothetical protein [Pseudolabrys sp.]